MSSKIVKRDITQFSGDFFSEKRKEDQLFGSVIYSEDEHSIEIKHNVVILKEKSFIKDLKIEFEGRITAQQGHGWMSVNSDPCTVVIDQTIPDSSYIQYIETTGDDL